MRIAMMTNNYKPFVGGVPISVERLACALRDLGQEVTVFAPSYAGMEEEEGVVRYRTLVSGVCGGIVIPDRLDPVIEEEFCAGTFDVIHVHHPMLIGRTALQLSGKYRVPLVFTWHTRYEQYLHYLGLSALRPAVPGYMRAFANQCDGVIAPAPGMETYLKETGVRAPIRILPTGLSKDSFRPDLREAARIRERFARGKRYLFITVARLAKEKNLGFLLESLAIRKRGGQDDFAWMLVGEGPEREALLEKAKGLELGENVRFAGGVDNAEIKNYCAASDLFLFSSVTETQGIVSLEAMAAGLPVLAVSAAGTEDIVQNRKNGYLTGLSATEFADRLERMLTEGEMERLSAGARATALAYREDKIAAKALSCYRAAAAFRWEKEVLKSAYS